MTKILIVDDDQNDIQNLSQLIQSEDVEIVRSESADKAIEVLTSSDIALALINMQLPRSGGLELAQQIRSMNRYQDLPMIFVTPHQQDQELIVQGYESGGVDILFRPLNPVIVRSKVRAFVELRKKTDQLKKSILELVQLKIEAEAANKAKTDFLANMSHEIRTPLSGVIGFSEILASPESTEAEKKRCRKAINQNGSQLMKLIDEILDYSKIESNQLELLPESFSLYELFRYVSETLSPRAHEKNIDLRFKVDAIAPEDWYWGDSHRIKQVLLNIIGNAIKFTHEGEVEVAVLIEGNRDQKVTIEISDRGGGIDEKFIHSLFTPFTQSDLTTSKQFGGAGLGLAISRRIMRLMGGDARLVSTSPAGSVFEVSFCVKREESKPRSKPKKFFFGNEVEIASVLTGKTILAVDDSFDNLELLEFMLDEYQVKLTCVQDGNTACDLVKHSSFDLILMDIQMPQLDGYETTRRIRASGFEGPIVALTAHVIRNEIEKCYAAGCNGVIGKPYSKTSLVSAITQYFQS